MNAINLKRSARVAGVFFILATACSVIAAVFISPILAEIDYLAAIYKNQNTVAVAVIFMLIAVISILGIAITLFPILKIHHQTLAMWFFCARLFEAVFYTLGIVFTLVLLGLARENTDVSGLGGLIRIMSDVAFNMGTLIIFSVSAIILGVVLCCSNLVPRWLSIWAVVGGVLLSVQGMLVIFDASTPTLAATLFIPIALNEMVLAVWLLVKGFKAP